MGGADDDLDDASEDADLDDVNRRRLRGCVIVDGSCGGCDCCCGCECDWGCGMVRVGLRGVVVGGEVAEAGGAVVDAAPGGSVLVSEGVEAGAEVVSDVEVGAGIDEDAGISVAVSVAVAVCVVVAVAVAEEDVDGSDWVDGTGSSSSSIASDDFVEGR